MMRGLGAALAAGFALCATSVVAAHGAGPPAVPGDQRELLVRFEPGAEQGEALREVGATLVERLPLRGLVRVRLDGRVTLAEADAALQRRDDVRYAEPNDRYELLATPNDPMFGSLWGLNHTSDFDIDAPEAWDVTKGSDAVTVAVVDTGIDYTHPDLVDNIWTNARDPVNGTDDDRNGLVDDARGWDFLGNDNAPLDVDDHGTHVAGTIGARGDNNLGVTGVNWRVKLMAVRAGDGASGFFESTIVSSFAYACAKGAKVINGSFGGDVYSAAIHDAITACPGALFVFAAGNGGGDRVGDNNDLAPVYPCSDPAVNVICVAASNDADALASFSNFGRTSVDVAAPGFDVLSTVSGPAYDSFDGTSMAAPHVAGVAALVSAYRPALSVAAVRRALLLSADPKPGLAGLVVSGGRLNARAALAQEIDPPTGLTASSPTHQPNTWSNVSAATFAWGGATDESGIDGYSHALSPLGDLVPDDVKDVEETVSSLTMTLADGIHWFHVRARDGIGNWSDAVHVGPIMVDTFQPLRPVPSSPSHRVGGASGDRTIDAAWSGAADSASGLDGYSFSWSKAQAAHADETKDAEESDSRTTSPPLEVGTWWFNIRARDNAGNWSETVSVGPFSIRRGPTVCAVPRLRGLTLTRARRLLAQRGCALGRVTRTPSRRVARGRIVAQRPAAGMRLRRGARVAVVLSRGRGR